jgi:hypothetical protein
MAHIYHHDLARVFSLRVGGTKRIARIDNRTAVVRASDKVVRFLRVGQPPEAPETGYSPVLALMPRKFAE